MTPPPPIDSATVDTGLPLQAVGPCPLPPGRWLRRLLGFMGPGYLIAVGYMDPGNWATDLAAGSGFGYDRRFGFGFHPPPPSTLKLKPAFPLSRQLR